ncbi:SGNH/GDSL hydrolase family protein [Mucilaginibacter sp. Mucisp84]|uniref:SGNH/GDSL hydrolase family protein n=1 Tax=Mucilaginibacter sp. Mucisp84 TaxID=3243058 RepID=UPI0039A65850
MFNDKFKKSLLIGSLLLNILFVLVFIGKRFYYSHYQLFHHVITMDERWANYLKSNPAGEVVFLGTSITEGFDVKQEFDSPKVKNMGFAGSISENGIQVINRLIYRKPAKVFIEFGVNDFKYGISEDTVKSHLIRMIDIIKQQSPKTVIFVQSVFPTDRDSLNNKILSYNKQANEICKQKDVTFLNLYPSFLRGNKIDKDLTFDGTHFTEAGYFYWRKLISEVVN